MAGGGRGPNRGRSIVNPSNPRRAGPTKPVPESLFQGQAAEAPSCLLRDRRQPIIAQGVRLFFDRRFSQGIECCQNNMATPQHRLSPI